MTNIRLDSRISKKQLKVRSKNTKTETIGEILKRRKVVLAGKTSETVLKTGKKSNKKVKKRTTNNYEKSKKQEVLTGDLMGLRHPEGYLEFIEFLATPKHLRGYKTQGEFAKAIGVRQDTLTDWKKRSGFYERLNKERRGIIDTELLSTAISALHKRIQKYGKGSDVKILFQIAGCFEEKLVTDNTHHIGKLSREKKEGILRRLGKWKN